jgi:hypothetical protein
MNIKLSTVLALFIIGVFPALSIYAWQTGGANVSEDALAVDIALAFMKNGPTYGFDGIPGTLTVLDTKILESYPVQYVVTIAFESRQAGYGDRSGQVLAQVITRHVATVKVVNNNVVSAVLDDEWDELNQRGVGEGSEEPPKEFKTPEFARDTAISFILRSHGELKGLTAPSTLEMRSVTWEERDLTPQGWLGWSKLEYAAEGWTVDVSWAVVLSPKYTVEVSFTGEKAFHWEGTVDQAGVVTETSFKLGK